MFGPFSAPVAYWTSPELKFANGDKRIKYNEKTHVISWPKVKGADGYFVGTNYIGFSGYNIFLQEVYAHNVEFKRTTKTTMKAWKYGHDWPTSVKYVIPYAIHDGYIFVSGQPITKSFADMISSLETYYD